ncbi:fucose-1-phosphate guanylyltransferase-like [Anneissia japonica]|uniref:fucose-1-phosphate guanylyltransferase-like n=1 Tax=Anneissia japonica TaxID=1529436 RepID=UPI0014255B35|nr:fucose-1-phosphate guanylyltransferase-like [Anneissia japonica]
MMDKCYNTDYIRSATANKVNRFQAIRGQDVGTVAFWDIVVITARDENQKRAYELQLNEKLKSKQLPLGVKYHAIADPPEAKVGNGGSTMHAMSHLQTIYEESLALMKVLLIHAGGYSQRLPNASLLGKAFMPVPLGDPLYQMLEMKLITYIDFPSRMDPGVFVCSSDTLELFVLSGSDQQDQWSFKTPGFTALAHQSSLLLGTTHGVFVLQEDLELESCDSKLVECLQFLHKPSVEVMQEQGAIRKHSPLSVKTSKDFVYTDSAYYMDFSTASRLIKFYRDHAPILCEIDAYGDFLQALGCRATPEYTKNSVNVSNETDTLVETREKVFNLLSRTSFNVIAFSDSVFYHLGTTTEYLKHLCDDAELQNQLCINNHAANTSEEPDNKKMKVSKDGTKKMCLMHSLVDNHVDQTHLSVVEYSYLRNVRIGSNCIISNCRLESKQLVAVPDNTFLSTACIQNNRTPDVYVTFIFSIHDDLKQSSESVADLMFIGHKIKEIFSDKSEQIRTKLFPHNVKVCKLWEMKLFTPAQTMEDSIRIALKLQMGILSGLKVNVDMFANSLSMASILEMKDIEDILRYRKNLFKLIKNL